jgi:hypothetical protein
MINTTPKPITIVSLSKNFDDQTLSPFTTHCNLRRDYSTTCATIRSASDTPHNYGGACPPSSFSSYGMSGYVCYVGNEEGSATANTESAIIYSFSLPSGTYNYNLTFKHLAFGSDGSDGGDVCVAEVLLFGSVVWSVTIGRCTVSYGTITRTGTVNWTGGTTELRMRLRVQRVSGGWMDHRNFTVDDVALTITQMMSPPPQVESPSMSLLIT